MKKDTLSKIEEALDGIRPYMQADGGNVRVRELTGDNVLKLEFLGNCGNCPMSSMTFQAGIKDAVMKAAPEIDHVEVVNIDVNK
ncbi:MAG: hypothetical protein CRN43_16760 [Candidatus Nephrothrix sp. EaCA]|nr:MAG: hypothetical protein CRN43_16760 [Candidatus Nephrothrix sp. EaCA]